jgi:hypothetical protein
MHDPANALYDGACDLLQAAQQFREAFDRPGSEAVLAPTLGCLEATLHELARALGLMRTDRLRFDGAPVTAAVIDLVDVLLEAERYCGAAREAAAGQPPSRRVAAQPSRRCAGHG